MLQKSAELQLLLYATSIAMLVDSGGYFSLLHSSGNQNEEEES